MSAHTPRRHDPSRREFLQATGAAVAGAAMLTGVSLAREEVKVAASDRITLGVIGYGPRCTYDLKPILGFADVQCVALADVQASRREAGKAAVDSAYKNSDLKLYSDFRELLDRKDIDAVLVATGDRWHAAASILAAKAGKDVYSEKPCGITIGACQELAATITKEKRIFQAGTQRRSVSNFAQAVEIAQTGGLGKLKKMHASVYVPILGNNWLEAETPPPKEVCDWNLWLGPAPWRPYNKVYVGGGWRGQWDFDSGARLLDWGAHTVDLCQWANSADNTMPISYEPNEKNIVCKYENGVELVIDFLANPFGDRSPEYISRLGLCPVRFIGEAGWVETGDSGEIATDVDALKEKLPPKEKRARGLDVDTHARNFFDCIRSRKPTIANQHVMRRSHITCHAAAIAWILKRPLKLDPVKEEFINDAEANLLRNRPERNWA